MEIKALDFSKKEKHTIIAAVTIGNLLEWYEIYLYVYWAPVISKLFFHATSDFLCLAHTFLIFGIGFLARPIGGIFFGRIGDVIGRKQALVLSLVIMIFPSFITAFLPTHAQIGILAPILLLLMRFLQSFPAGGEIPGAFCYLYESSEKKHRRYMSSWSAVGYQVGILISTIECFVLEKYLSHEALLTWGWRLSFLIGGIIGLIGLCLRYKLHETPLYKDMLTHEKVVRDPILKVVLKYRKGIFLGMLFCALNSASFYVLSINLPLSFGKGSGDNSAVLIFTILLLIAITLPLPFFGALADRFSNRKLLIGSTIGIALLLYPIHLCIAYSYLITLGVLVFIFSLFFTMLSALIPYILCDLFPTQVRFTCVSISFNIADAVIGGFTPVIVLYLFHITGSKGSFGLFLMVCAILSLIGYLKLKDRKPRSLDHTSFHS